MPAPKKKKKLAEQQLLPMSLSEFKAKIEGIEMFQGDDWCPTKEQWDLIRKMIGYIEEEEVEPEVVYRQVPTQQPMYPQPQPQPMPVAQQPMPPVHRPVAESALPDVDLSNMEEVARVAVPVAQTDQQTVRTPDIDTSGGDYNSPFT